MVSFLRNSWARPVLVAGLCALAVSGCAATKKNKPRLAYEERPVELLYSTGADRLDRHLWSQAVDYFQEVERQHPYSEWSRRSILMQAFAHYQANNYDEAIGDADRFISLYPGNATAAYAHYLKAICYFEQIVDVGRDQAATGQALENLREVTQRYPRTEYASDARLKIDMVNDQLAGKEMTIGRYYLRQGDTLAAVGRFKTVIDRYQTTSHTPEALYRLVESYLTLGLLDQVAFARLTIEPRLAELASAALTPKLIDRLEAIDDRVDAAIRAGEVPAYLESNHAFHFALYEVSEAAVLLDMARSLWLRFGPSLRVVCARFGTAALPDRHEEALAAMRAADGAALARAIERDIAQGVDQVRAALARGEI